MDRIDAYATSNMGGVHICIRLFGHQTNKSHSSEKIAFTHFDVKLMASPPTAMFMKYHAPKPMAILHGLH